MENSGSLEGGRGGHDFLTGAGDGLYVVPMQPARNLGAWLRREGRKQIWLAQKIGAHPTTVSNVVRGKRRPTMRQAFKIAEVTLGEILPDTFGYEIGEVPGATKVEEESEAAVSS